MNTKNKTKNDIMNYDYSKTVRILGKLKGKSKNNEYIYLDLADIKECTHALNELLLPFYSVEVKYSLLNDIRAGKCAGDIIENMLEIAFGLEESHLNELQLAH